MVSIHVYIHVRHISIAKCKCQTMDRLTNSECLKGRKSLKGYIKTSSRYSAYLIGPTITASTFSPVLFKTCISIIYFLNTKYNVTKDWWVMVAQKKRHIHHQLHNLLNAFIRAGFPPYLHDTVRELWKKQFRTSVNYHCLQIIMYCCF